MPHGKVDLAALLALYGVTSERRINRLMRQARTRREERRAEPRATV